jgi:hypothetical protein
MSRWPGGWRGKAEPSSDELQLRRIDPFTTPPPLPAANEASLARDGDFHSAADMGRFYFELCCPGDFESVVIAYEEGGRRRFRRRAAWTVSEEPEASVVHRARGELGLDGRRPGHPKRGDRSRLKRQRASKPLAIRTSATAHALGDMNYPSPAVRGGP